MTDMKQRSLSILLVVGVIILCSILSSGCRKETPLPTQLETPILTTETTLPSPTPTIAATPLPPTSTSEPLALLINGEGITLAEFEAEFARYQQAVGTNLATNSNQDARQQVLDEIINFTLLSQAARASGFSVDEAALQERIDQLVSQLGSAEKLENWMSEFGYTLESFRNTMTRSIEAGWMRDQILASIPEALEQIHARQILLYNSAQADQIYAQLKSGQDFRELAFWIDPITGGDLGWFPRGYLTEKALEDVLFSLQVGEYSPVIETHLGFHILLVVERDPQRRVDPNARFILQEQALLDWLKQHKEQSDIQILLP